MEATTQERAHSSSGSCHTQFCWNQEKVASSSNIDSSKKLYNIGQSKVFLLAPCTKGFLRGTWGCWKVLSSTLYLDQQESGPKIKTAACMQSFQGTSEKKVCVNWPVGCRVMPVFLWCTKTTGKHRLYNVGISNGMALIRHRNYWTL